MHNTDRDFYYHRRYHGRIAATLLKEMELQGGEAEGDRSTIGRIEKKRKEGENEEG